ncbi:EAL domain-containing protein [Paenibacillus hexagrammi]|uniref:EAL domain-containing protein n=1 Tax=Paenibacillus hexagrammi TaxID=2908839 RepID=A0ABY3SCJ0_9BACL|nr:EAL domain-containing protein [Paenibacillus sp. YPD9-1]UJF31658.1 EAL domain-containing protein [Paenibacillus sp. YPD9-1]
MSQKIPVTRDGKKGSDILLIDSHRVVKIDKIRDRDYVIHTKDHHYYLDLSLDSIEEWLYEDGFRLLDSTNIVNMKHVKEYDSRKGIVYFDSPTDKKTKTASAARIHKEHIENVMSILQSSDTDKAVRQPTNQHPEIQPPFFVMNDDDQFSRSYATIRAMNAKRQAEEKIVHMAYHDSLTNLPNRLKFQEHLKDSFAKAESSDTLLGVLFFDLDRFKIINDTLGHHAGDQLLQHIASKLSEYVGDKHTVARFGGDEFIILMTGVNSIDEITDFARGIPECLKEAFYFEKQELYITASIGISLYPHDGNNVESLIKNADVAMYKAKEKGGNIYELYHPDMNMRSMHRLNLEIELRKAIEREEFMVYYQPLVDLTTGSIFGMESLVRWKHPEWGMVSPGEFIPLAEETGLIIPLGNWVLKQACIQNTKWNSLGLAPLCVSVNISVNQFMQTGFVQFIEDTLKQTGLTPNLLCLEITESVAMKNVSFIMETMDKLRMLGVQISIDDFGTGYSSLSYLKRFRVHTLKIDQSFIRDVTTDEDNAAIVTALIAMSQQLKIKSLAEGVETPEQLAFLRERGCNEIQGYIFSTPLPAESFENLIKEKKTLYLH